MFLKAAYEGNLTSLEALLPQVDVNHTEAYESWDRKYGKAAIHYAAEGGHLSIIEFLIENGVDPNVKTIVYGEAVIHIAAESGHLNVIEFLIENGVDPNVKTTEFGNAAIHSAAIGGHLDAINYLLENGTDPNLKTELFGRTALHYGADNGHLDICELLLKAGAAADAQDKFGITALHGGASNGHLDVCELLLKAGAAADAQDKDGRTALLIAKIHDREDIIELLLEAGAKEVKGKDISIVAAAENGDLGLVRYLLKTGVDHDSTDCLLDGKTALHYGAERGHLDVCELLLESGAPADTQDKFGKIALHYAAERGQLDVCELLLKAGAPADARNEGGKTALHYGAERGHLNVCELLLKAGAPADARDEFNNTVLHYGAAERHLDVCELLLKAGAPADAQDKVGNTALHYAAIYGETRIVKLLIQFGADVNISNKNGETAEQLAKRYDQSFIAQLLKKEGQRQELRKDLQETYCFDTNVPVRVIFAGPALSGKTTLVRSFHLYASKQEGILTSLVQWATWASSKEPLIEPKSKSTQIAEDFKDRTIGAEFHLLKVEDDLYLNIQDLAGQEGFYALHSALLHQKQQAIFFVIFNLENSIEQLQKDVKSQLKMILSHSTCQTTKSIIFLGTHVDQVRNASTKIEQAKHLLCELEGTFNINNSQKLFVDARNPSDKEMADILKSTRELATQIRTRLKVQDKMLPEVSLEILKALQMESLKSRKIILEWSFVLETVKQKVKKTQVLDGYDLYLMLCLLKDYSLLILIGPEYPEQLERSKYETNECGCIIAVDLNWVFNQFLGVLFAPDEFRVQRDLCKDGCIAKRNLVALFERCNINFDLLIKLLDYYEIILEKGKNEVGDEEYVIPAVMKKDKDPKWFSNISSYRYIFGRECYSELCLTMRTMHCIQHALGKTFEVSSINYFKKGLFIKSDCCEILVEADDHLSRVQVKVGAQDKFCDDKNEENIKTDCEEILWKTFHDIVLLKVIENNDSISLTKRILSWNGLKQGRDVWYPIQSVIQHHDSKKTIIHHTALDDENPVHDEISSLLTKREIETFCQLKVVENKNVQTVSRDSSSGSQIITIINPVGKVHIGPSTISVVESSNLTAGDSIEIVQEREHSRESCSVC